MLKLLFILFISFNTYAQNGNMDSTNRAHTPHGGNLQKWGSNYIELLHNSKSFKIYFLDNKMNSLSKLPYIETKLIFPDKKTMSPELQKETDHYFSWVDFKNSKKVTLLIKIPEKNKISNIKFQILLQQQ
jgi:hypothetical protein